MLKVAMVADRRQLRESGEPRVPHLLALADALSAAGHEVTVFAHDGKAGATLADKRGDVSGRPDRHRFEVRGYRDGQLTAALQECAPDVVHAHTRTVGLAAAAGARALDVPFVFSTHTTDDFADPAVLRSAHHVVAIYSEQVPVLRTAGVLRPGISVVPHGVDVDHFTPEGERAEKTRPHRLVATGPLARSSGFATPIAALPAIPETELLLVVDNPRGEHARELRDLARATGVADRVRLTGPVGRAGLPVLVRSADLVVCSPWEATFGAPALEAMACGVAVVANRLGGLADTVVDRVTGTHVTPRKPRELATVLRAMLAHRATREQQGAAGRDRACARYSWHRVATETMHAYHRAGAPDPVVLEQEAAARARKRGGQVIARA